MAQSKMTTDMAYSKVEETVRGLISEKMMLKSQVQKLQRDLIARDRESQENSNLVVQLQSEKELLIQAKQEADRQTERLATTVQLNIQKHEILKVTLERLRRTSEAVGKMVKEGEEWRHTKSKNLTDIIEALDKDRNKKFEQLEHCQIECRRLHELIESMVQEHAGVLQESNVRMEQMMNAKYELEQQLEATESNRVSLEGKMALLTSELAGSHATTEALREEIRLLNTKLEDSEKVRLLQAQDIKVLGAEKTESLQLIETLKQDLIRSDAAVTELTTANEKQRLDIQVKNSSLQEVQQVMLMKENESLQTVNSLQEALEKSEKMKEAQRMEVEKLQQQLSQLQLENSSLMTSVQSKQSSLKTAEDAIASLTLQISSLNFETINLQTLLNDKIQKLEDENIELEQAKERLEAVVNDHMANIKNLEEASRAKEETISRLTDQLNEANAHLEGLMEQKGTLEEALNEKSSLIAKLEVDWKLKEASFQEILATMKTESKGDLDNLNTVVAELQYKLQGKEAMVTSLQEEVNSLKSTQMELLTKQADDRNEIQHRESTIDSLNYRIQEQEEKRIMLENQITGLLESKVETSGQLKVSCEEAEKLGKNLQASRAEVLHLNQQLKDVKSASEEKLEEFQSNVAQELKVKDSAMQALNAQVVEANNKVSIQDKELSSLRKSIAQSSRAFENERQSWAETQARLEQKVQSLEEEVEKHIEIAQQSSAELQKLSSKVKSLEVQNERMTTDLESMTGELSTARAAVELKARECESLNQEQAKLWNDIQQKSEKIRDLEQNNKTLETDIQHFMKSDDDQPTSTKRAKASNVNGGSTKKTVATRAKTATTKTVRPQLKSYSRIQNPYKPLEPEDDNRPAIPAGSYVLSPLWTSTPNPEAAPIKPLHELLQDTSLSSLFADYSPPSPKGKVQRTEEEKKAAARRFWGKKY